MEGLNNQVIKSFGLKAKNMRKVKGFYIVNTASGAKIIKKSFDNAQSIVFQHEIKNRLIHNNFDTIDKYYLSTANLPYVNYENGLYVCTDCIAGDEADFAADGMFLKIIKASAAFYTGSKGADFSDEVYVEGDLVKLFQNSKRDMEQIKKQINNQGRLSDFDILFIKNYDYYHNNVKKAISIMNNTNYLGKLSQARKEKAICHNQLKKENMIMAGNKIYITNFSYCKVDYFIWDMANLICRYVKHRKTELISLQDIISAYAAQAPFDEDDRQILNACLLHPTAFLKAVRQYYSKRRSWAPSSIINRMETVIDGKDIFENFISGTIGTNSSLKCLK